MTKSYTSFFVHTPSRAPRKYDARARHAALCTSISVSLQKTLTSLCKRVVYLLQKALFLIFRTHTRARTKITRRAALTGLHVFLCVFVQIRPTYLRKRAPHLHKKAFHLIFMHTCAETKRTWRARSTRCSICIQKSPTSPQKSPTSQHSSPTSCILYTHLHQYQENMACVLNALL